MAGRGRNHSGARPAATYRAATTGNLAWLGSAIDKHYGGDDSGLNVILQAFGGLTDGVSVENYATSVGEFFVSAKHPLSGRPYSEAVYQPMVELLRYLERHGFMCYIVSGGERDFMRPMTQGNYGIPPERVIGSAFGLSYDAETRSSAMRRRSRTSTTDRRNPSGAEAGSAAGHSSPPKIQRAQGALTATSANEHTVVSVRHDWETVFPPSSA